jgi:hypothetical protein
MEVAATGDGFVIASPNNTDADYPTLTVTNGVVTFDQPYAAIAVGLPYLCDLETLDIDTPGGESIADKRKIVQRVTAYVDQTRGLWVGGKPPCNDSVDPLEGLTEAKTREHEFYDDPIDLATKTIQINMQSGWNSNGRTFLRQVDPLPITVLGIYPGGMYPMGRAG